MRNPQLFSKLRYTTGTYHDSQDLDGYACQALTMLRRWHEAHRDADRRTTEDDLNPRLVNGRKCRPKRKARPESNQLEVLHDVTWGPLHREFLGEDTLGRAKLLKATGIEAEDAQVQNHATPQVGHNNDINEIITPATTEDCVVGEFKAMRARAQEKERSVCRRMEQQKWYTTAFS